MDDFPSNTSIYKGFSMARLNKQMVYYIYIYIPEGPGVLRWRSGGVGWGMLPSWCYVDGRGGVGSGMLPSCSCYVDATLMGGVGWGGACYRHVHVTLMLRCWEGWGGVGHVTVMFTTWIRTTLAVHYLNKNPGLDAVLSALARFRSTVASGLVAPSRAFLEAPWEKWKKRFTVVACVLLPKHSVFTVCYIEWKHKNRLTVSTCNFLHIATSLQITVQK